MSNKTNRETYEKLLAVLGMGYETGNFEPLYPYLADDCVWESQWRLIPEEGKDRVIGYFTEKGKLMRESNACPRTMLVELVGDMNPIEGEVTIGDEEPKMAGAALLYENGSLALLMAQRLNDATNAVIVQIKVNEDDLISRIDLCMPELFRYVKHEIK